MDQPVPAVGQGLIERERLLGVMGTDLQIKVFGEDADALDVAIDAAFRELQRVEDLMTDWRASPLTSLNENAGSGPYEVPLELVAIISRARQVSALTSGAFDCTYAAVGRLWDFKADPPRIPTAEQVAEQLPFVDNAKILVEPGVSMVDLPAGMSIGLGGIAKGYGVDRAMAVLIAHGVENAIVNCGGDLKVLGLEQAEPWEIALKHPRDQQRAMAVLGITNTCVVTSGDYERFFEVNGRRYHHILDPRTGYPSTGCMSATVVAQSAEYADALATALCVLGPEKGLALIDGLSKVEAIVVDMEGKVHASDGLQAALIAGELRGK